MHGSFPLIMLTLEEPPLGLVRDAFFVPGRLCARARFRLVSCEFPDGRSTQMTTGAACRGVGHAVRVIGISPLLSRIRSGAGSMWVKDSSGGSMTGTATNSYTSFVEEAGQRLRLGLIARYGPEVGAEATAEALAYGWEHWDRLASMPNPAGYLYRVGQSRSRALFRARRWLNRRSSFPVPPNHPELSVEPGLPKALRALSDKQRVAVLLVHGFGFSVREVAELLNVVPSTVQRNADRALARLRDSLGVTHVA